MNKCKLCELQCLVNPEAKEPACASKIRRLQAEADGCDECGKPDDFMHPRMCERCYRRWALSSEIESCGVDDLDWLTSQIAAQRENEEER